MASSPEEIQKHVKAYLLVGATLFVCTVLTVAVAKVEFIDLLGEKGFDVIDLVIGLAIATFKASLVAYIFMHLKGEKKMIYFLFGLAGFFAICLYFLTAFHFWDPIEFEAFFRRG